MEQAEKETLDGIFNQSTVCVNGKNYPLHFTVAAEIWLENNGNLHMGTLAKAMATKPTETIFKLVFAGLPPEQCRENMSFEDFCKNLNPEEAKKITARVEWILDAYFRHLLGVLDELQHGKQEPVKKN